MANNQGYLSFIPAEYYGLVGLGQGLGQAGQTFAQRRQQKKENERADKALGLQEREIAQREREGNFGMTLSVIRDAPPELRGLLAQESGFLDPTSPLYTTMTQEEQLAHMKTVGQKVATERFKAAREAQRNGDSSLMAQMTPWEIQEAGFDPTLAGKVDLLSAQVDLAEQEVGYNEAWKESRRSRGLSEVSYEGAAAERADELLPYQRAELAAQVENINTTIEARRQEMVFALERQPLVLEGMRLENDYLGAQIGRVTAEAERLAGVGGLEPWQQQLLVDQVTKMADYIPTQTNDGTPITGINIANYLNEGTTGNETVDSVIAAGLVDYQTALVQTRAAMQEDAQMQGLMASIETLAALDEANLAETGEVQMIAAKSLLEQKTGMTWEIKDGWFSSPKLRLSPMQEQVVNNEIRKQLGNDPGSPVDGIPGSDVRGTGSVDYTNLVNEVGGPGALRDYLTANEAEAKAAFGETDYAAVLLRATREADGEVVTPLVDSAEREASSFKPVEDMLQDMTAEQLAAEFQTQAAGRTIITPGSVLDKINNELRRRDLPPMEMPAAQGRSIGETPAGQAIGGFFRGAAETVLDKTDEILKTTPGGRAISSAASLITGGSPAVGSALGQGARTAGVGSEAVGGAVRGIGETGQRFVGEFSSAIDRAMQNLELRPMRGSVAVSRGVSPRAQEQLGAAADFIPSIIASVGSSLDVDGKRRLETQLNRIKLAQEKYVTLEEQLKSYPSEKVRQEASQLFNVIRALGGRVPVEIDGVWHR